MTTPTGGRWVPGNRWDLAPAPTRPPSVTVVVTHYEQPAQLALTLAALAGQTHPADLLQVVVADDGSATAPVVPAGVEVVTQPDEGFRAARVRNLAAERAHGDVLLFLDADTVPEPTYVAAMARLPGVLPEAVVVGRRRHADLSGLVAGGDVATEGREHELTEPPWLRDAYAASGDLLRADETSYRFVVGAVTGCSRWFFEQTGGFDPSFTTYGGEDWEWAHRAWTHGAVLAHVSDAVAWHDGASREDRPGWGTDPVGRERLLQETLAIASRVPVPGVAPQSLLGGAGDPVVSLAPDVVGDALVLCLDSLLDAWPRARVLLDPARHHLVPSDPRVLVHDGHVLEAAAARSAWRHLHVVRAVTGARAAWRTGTDLLHGPDAEGRVDVAGRTGEVVARWSSLRVVRRETRWPDLPRAEPVLASADLVTVPEGLTAQARWGGWA
jgi:GT2 family glycosyltransferase